MTCWVVDVCATGGHGCELPELRHLHNRQPGRYRVLRAARRVMSRLPNESGQSQARANLNDGMNRSVASHQTTVMDTGH
jgi:hypothetical protein